MAASWAPGCTIASSCSRLSHHPVSECRPVVRRRSASARLVECPASTSLRLLQGCALGVGMAVVAFPDLASSAVDVSTAGTQVADLLAKEPSNALSLPTWTIHVLSVAEWVTAMSLVWQYGGTPGNGAWKGLAWGMVPSLGGALCACTWHFFYNANSLTGLVVLQSGLTLVGNFTMWMAAFRIFLASQRNSSA